MTKLLSHIPQSIFCVLNVMLDYIKWIKNYMLWQGIQINKLICWGHKLMVELNSCENKKMINNFGVDPKQMECDISLFFFADSVVSMKKLMDEFLNILNGFILFFHSICGFWHLFLIFCLLNTPLIILFLMSREHKLNFPNAHDSIKSQIKLFLNTLS